MKFFKYIGQRYKENIFFACVMSAFLAFCVFDLIYCAVKGMWRNFALGWAFTAIYFAEFGIECIFKVKLKPLFLIVVLFVPIGAMLGYVFEFYHIFSWWDDLLHTVSGFDFAALGYILFEKVIREENGKRKFFICLVCGFLFSLTIGFLWEMVEYAGTTLFDADMEEDSIIYSIKSYFLNNSHNNIAHIDNIERTVIYYDGGKEYEIAGYLDVGLGDTLNDMLVCLIGSVAYMGSFILSFFCRKKFISAIVTSEIMA